MSALCPERYEGCPCGLTEPHVDHQCEHCLVWDDDDLTT